MSLSIYHILFLSLGLLLGWYFFSELKVRELTLQAARKHCQLMQVQLLDQSVGLYRVWFKRGADKRLHWWRNYQFEFTSTGEERYQGFIIVLGNRVESIDLGVHKFPDQEN
ncbi:MAG: hypothetical protein CL692_03945 [Cellvibrionales bacterium]|nr:hypothetical protein [Cellvibrionales bacterium]